MDTEEVRGWLKMIQLEEYTEVFCQNGFDRFVCFFLHLVMYLIVEKGTRDFIDERGRHAADEHQNRPQAPYFGTYIEIEK